MPPAVAHAPPAGAVPDAVFEAMFRRELGYVLASLRRLGVRPGDVEDLAHDVFVVALRRLADLDPARPARPWLFGIALRVAADHRRLARNRYERADDARTADAPARGAPESDAIERRSVVQRGLDALDLDKRAVLILHDVEGRAMPEIAQVLGIPLNTAYSRLRLARERFRQAVTEPRGGTP